MGKGIQQSPTAPHRRPANKQPRGVRRDSMAEPLQCVPSDSILTGWDFSTGAVKCLAFDLDGHIVAEVRLPTDLWDRDGASELNLMQLEGQARASTRAIAAQLREQNRLKDWVAGGI